MENTTVIDKSQMETLESEIKKFAETLPYWAKFLANKILSGGNVSDNDIDTSYSYLLEELKLKAETNKPDITINCITNSGNYQSDLRLSKLENVEGVNALVENQSIVFSPNLTIIYGTNGSGKSGYVRLLKKVFYPKSPEEILNNIYIETGHKDINAKFTFKTQNSEKSLFYADKDKTEFKQFAVFDGKSIITHLEQKNEFVFRPTGLNFFAEYTNTILRVEQKLNDEITTKKQGNSANELASLFDGESEIKTLIQNLNDQTTIADLKKYVPFENDDNNKKNKISKQYDDLLLVSKGKEQEIKKLENIKALLAQNKQAIENLNKYFSTEAITKINLAIEDCIKKEYTANSESIEKFKTSKIQGIGTIEWKNFILAAEAFAKRQNANYPSENDTCLFCGQNLSENATILISNYWAYIKSVAEQQAKEAQEKLNNIKQDFGSLNFGLFPQNNTLTVWLTEKYPSELELLEKKIVEQRTLSEKIISDIKQKTVTNITELQISTEQHDIIDFAISNSINSLKNDEQSKELENLLKQKTFWEHKEKFNIHFSKFETYVNNQIWISKAEKVNYDKRKITATEKKLSDKYFNKKYIDTFNEECQKLNGNFGIDINHTGQAGKSYRQLKLKGKNPNAVLSDGEQKVIAIADFLTEMQLSEINRGLVFDDPVNSLDNDRKKQIAERLVNQAINKQVIIFTHDLVFLSDLFIECDNRQQQLFCHWIERRDNKIGQIWLNNAPCYEKMYRNADVAKKYHTESNKDTCPPTEREILLKHGFAALRTCYETLVINELFCNVVQRYNERISIDALSKVIITDEIKNELSDSFAQCCRYMEGHSHSDQYSYQKPETKNLNEEIQRYEAIRKKIKDAKK